MENEMKPDQIGLIGGPFSGKTTMILMLQRSTENNVKGFSINPLDDDTEGWLIENKDQRISKNLFPNATIEKPRKLKFLISQRAKDGKLYHARLFFEDRPGGDYISRIENEMEDYLLSCGGWIFLIDPGSKDNKVSDLINNLLNKLDRRRNQNRNGQRIMTGDSFSQRISVCFNQYDDHHSGVFQFLRDKGLLSSLIYKGVHNTPYLSSEKCISAIQQWFPDYGQIIKIFKTRFNPENVEFFGTSSIGFFRPGRNDPIDWDNCDNVDYTPKEKAIKIDLNLLSPVNVNGAFDFGKF